MQRSTSKPRSTSSRLSTISSLRQASKLSRSRGNKSLARDEAHSRLHDLRQEIEATAHVLDNDIDRTPLPLQRRHSVLGISGASRYGRDSVMTAGDMGSSILHSSFLSSGDFQTQSRRVGEDSQGSGRQAFAGMSGFGAESTSQSALNSGQRNVDVSTSFAESGDSVSKHLGARDSAAGLGVDDLSHLLKPQTLLDGAEVAKVQPMTEEARRAWRKASTTITLRETPTILLYAHQDEAVPSEAPDTVRAVKERNETLSRLEAAARVHGGSCGQQRGTTTFTAPSKSVHCETRPPRRVDAGALQVTPWMLRDAFAELAEADDNVETAQEETQQKTEAEEDAEAEELNESLKDESTADAESASHATPTEKTQSLAQGQQAQSQANNWMFASSLMSSLRVMERAVVQNYMAAEQLAYRGVEPPPAAARDQPASAQANIKEGGEAVSDAVLSPALPSGEHDPPKPLLHTSDDVQMLWSYRSPLTRGRAVTSMAWNCREPDILAVSYGAQRGAAAEASTHGGGGEGNQNTSGVAAEAEKRSRRGLICCWTLKNPLAPEMVWHYEAEAGVTALAFSAEHSSLLAVGDAGGRVAVYDIQKDIVAPSIRPNTTAGLHTEAVWELQWVAREKEGGEYLRSISADGRVVQWVVGKAIEKLAPDLMHLTRQAGAQVEPVFVDGVAELDAAAGRHHTSATRDVVFSQQTGGMCFDVCPSDAAVYVVGTEDGGIFLCNTSQTESYDRDYMVHADLVYRIRFSPYNANYFLTCSADWSSRLYCLDQSTPRIVFDSPNQDAVQDIAWCHTNSIHFATVTARGNVELWSLLDAVNPKSFAEFEDHRRLSCVLFAEQEVPVVVVGDEEGEVTVFRLTSAAYTRQKLTDDEQEEWVNTAVQRHTT